MLRFTIKKAEHSEFTLGLRVLMMSKVLEMNFGAGKLNKGN
jgi:hypothetical protein